MQWGVSKSLLLLLPIFALRVFRYHHDWFDGKTLRQMEEILCLHMTWFAEVKCGYLPLHL